MEITDTDIDRVAEIMGKDFSDTERRKVIGSIDCCDVNACPGSGKTTTLVAKLLIMSEKLAGTMTGFCGLSHTNVAKNEIEKSFGSFSGALLRYPHFVGTFQVFIDVFLAIPAYIEEFGRRPIAIDDDLYEDVARKSYHQIKSNIRLGLEKRTNKTNQDPVSNVSYGFSNFDLVYFNSNQEKEFNCSPKTETYKEILRWKKKLTSLGYLTFHDAYAYANRYLQRYPNWAETISRRFAYVFIDEMQDTDAYQNEIIERIFRGRAIIQRFGDPNQTIYGRSVQDNNPIWRPEKYLSIRTSRRLSRSISKISQGICSQPCEIIGHPDVPDCPHTIILFDKKKMQDVIPRFGEIIKELNLQNGPFKAIGAVGRENQKPDKLSITSYWPTFQSNLLQNKFNNPFGRLVYQAYSSIIKTKKYTEAYQLLTKAFATLLYTNQIKTPDNHFFNSTQLIRLIRESGVENFARYQSILLSNCEKLFLAERLEVDDLLTQARLFFSFLGIQLTEHMELQIREYDQNDWPDQVSDAVDSNIYHHSADISIKINTIHAVKGQTHQATLVLETFYHHRDLPTIFPYLIGQRLSRPGERILNHFLPKTYVACTRPSHLLCLAIEREHVGSDKQCELRDFGWRVDELV